MKRCAVLRLNERYVGMERSVTLRLNDALHRALMRFYFNNHNNQRVNLIHQLIIDPL